jgi:hypothetical protein
MTNDGPVRAVRRILADACIGLVLFLTLALAHGAYERAAVVTHRLGDILAVSSSAGDLLKFPLNDSPLIAAAVVATAIPVPRSGPKQHHPSRHTALLLLAAMFSGLVAFNLAFFRHLRREYASPR